MSHSILIDAFDRLGDVFRIRGVGASHSKSDMPAGNICNFDTWSNIVGIGQSRSRSQDEVA